MITLYANQVSNYCAKVRVVLEAKTIAYCVVPPPGGYGSAEYKRLVPMGTIPAIDHDGVVLSESEAINEYLEEVFPEPPLLYGSAAQRAEQRSFARFHDLLLEPPMRALFVAVDPRHRDAERVAAQTRLFAERLLRLESLGRFQPFLAGASLSLADVAYPATLRLAELMFATFGLVFPTTPKIERWRAVLADLPAVAGPLAIAEAATQSWIAGKQP